MNESVRRLRSQISGAHQPDRAPSHNGEPSTVFAQRRTYWAKVQ
jgi:hypothetical protein